MALSPFRGFHDIHSEMNRMLGETLGSLALWPGRRSSGVAEWSPVLDVLQEDGDIVVRAEIPGVKQEDVEITFQNGILTISGEREAERQKEESGYYMRERRYGSFARSLPLPDGVDEGDISARFRDGILEVRVTGAGAVEEPRRIQIEGA